MTSCLKIERVEQPAILWRIGNNVDGEGLWYTKHGKETFLVRTLPDAIAATLPMGPDPVFRADGRRWISVTDSFSRLTKWFSKADAAALIRVGYSVEAIAVARYRRLHFPTYSHEAYCREDAVTIRYFNEMLEVWP